MQYYCIASGEWEMDEVLKAALEKFEGPLIEGAVKLDCIFHMPRPQKFIWKRRRMPPRAHIVTPDCDNLVKGLKEEKKNERLL